MFTFEEMILRLVVAMVLGAIVGFERELAGKEAGIRTDIIVGAGAAIFTIAGLSLPYIISSPENLTAILSSNAGFLNVIANIVIGIGFLGAGIIIQQGERVHGLTTAASVWFVAAIGVLCGIGLIEFAAVATVILTSLLFVFRKVNLLKMVGKDDVEVR